MKFFQPIINLFKRKPKELEQIKQLTKIEIIDYVVDYFQKNPRAKEKDREFPRCVYLTKTGLRCAHSICLEDEFLKDKEIKELGSAYSVINKYGDDIHKPQFRGHESEFWSEIQILHDDNRFWRDSGLTDDGKEFVKELKEKYSQ